MHVFSAQYKTKYFRTCRLTCYRSNFEHSIIQTVNKVIIWCRYVDNYCIIPNEEEEEEEEGYHMDVQYIE